MNGLDHRYEKHSIEDHLVELAIVEGLVEESAMVRDSKSKWLEVSRYEEIRRGVYRGILDSKHTPVVFEQHISAVRALTEGLD